MDFTIEVSSAYGRRSQQMVETIKLETPFSSPVLMGIQDAAKLIDLLQKAIIEAKGQLGQPVANDASIEAVITNANINMHKRPNMRTLLEEVSEAVLADRGKHEHPLSLELTQIAGVCINMLRQIEAGYQVGLKAGLDQTS